MLNDKSFFFPAAFGPRSGGKREWAKRGCGWNLWSGLGLTKRSSECVREEHKDKR
ncbi:MAG: hypothetical protein NVSMB62_10430 [Acidobacteriaceae bacterium]